MKWTYVAAWRWRIIGRQTRYNKISPTVSFLSRQPIGGFSIGLSPKFLSNVTSWCMPLAVLSIGCPLIIVITPYPRPEIGMRFKFQVISSRLSGVVSWEGQTKTMKFIYCRHSLNCLVFLCMERCPSRWVSVGSKLRSLYVLHLYFGDLFIAFAWQYLGDKIQLQLSKMHCRCLCKTRILQFLGKKSLDWFHLFNSTTWAHPSNKCQVIFIFTPFGCKKETESSISILHWGEPKVSHRHPQDTGIKAPWTSSEWMLSPFTASLLLAPYVTWEEIQESAGSARFSAPHPNLVDKAGGAVFVVVKL